MSHYDAIYELGNLRRAYRWIQSNPDALYKQFFRSAYRAYAISSEKSLNRLRTHLRRQDYQPGHASKVFLPKPSGVLRPISLLSINDQIVYQACANIIAERLQPRIAKRQGVHLFGHSYAGKSSPFFFKEWKKQYRTYSKIVIQHIHAGNDWVAEFDLAAFYDSIDHNVLAYFLADIGLDLAFREFLLKCLKTWTASTWRTQSPAIYAEHGIPQGPIASGLVSEVLLQYLDRVGTRGKRIKYLRYVDDIKLFATTEGRLRQKVVALDLASKDIGLFPQSSKINIRQVRHPAKEIKSVSIPPEPAEHESPDSPALRARVLELIRERPVRESNATRFKYLLGNVKPHHTLNSKLIALAQSQPELASNVARYFQKYNRLPRKAAEELCELLTQDWVYHAPQAELLNATRYNMPEPWRAKCLNFCHNRVTGRTSSFIPAQPTLTAAMASWCIKHARFTFHELERYFASEGDWWVKQAVLPMIEDSHFGAPSFLSFLQSTVEDKHADVARAAAAELIDRNPQISMASMSAHESAKLLFQEAGYLRSLARPRSLVGAALEVISKRAPTCLNWHGLLGQDHRRAEELGLQARRYFESNSIDACVVQLDSLLDMVFEKCFIIYAPNRTYPNYGSALQHPTLMAQMPSVCDGFRAVHQLRIRSQMAHPRDQKTGSVNRPLKHRHLRKVRPRLQTSLLELEQLGF